jgi:hypothetical protein
MKKLAVTLSLLAIAAGAFAQGTVNPGNTGTTRFQTNSTGIGGGVGNAVAATGPGFYYEVLTAPSTVTTVDASLQGLIQSGTQWMDTGLRATNTAIAGAMAGATGVNNWGIGVSQSYIIVGWSGSLGTSWATVAGELNGASLVNNVWGGPNFTATGFLGATAIGWRQAGGVIGATTIPTASIFGTVDDAQGTTIKTPTSMYFVNVPEPTSFALAGLGAAALMIFRRRKV